MEERNENNYVITQLSIKDFIMAIRVISKSKIFAIRYPHLGANIRMLLLLQQIMGLYQSTDY